ncbi:DUF3426 domain-containing protein [Noviluteimonas gilva]|uniref:DUF3426 domain-containing protein n=1 Tax=Noviluteimonas gilva TaxID=2682097 RepID=A0A7C9MKB0_9GAMM|nr:DUF3426 domain-containing protein [Lysobacter gilvus]MUV12807.1 DUF3426 domain-containing protein [Lysobacter gilvus]
MFVLCPHCQFLVTLDPRSGRAPEVCPSCGKPLDAQSQETVESTDVPVEATPEPEAPVAPPEPTPEPTPEPPPAEPDAEPAPQPAQLNADAVIALMAQKPPRKARAEKPVEKPAKRKREPAPKPAPVVKPPAPPKVERPAGPPMSVRIAAWWASVKPKAKPKVEKPVADKKPAADETKKRATVRPVSSLRERAAKRAEDARVAPAVQVEAPVVETQVVVSPVVDAPVVETPVVETPVVETPVVATPIEPARVETAPIEFIPLALTPVEAALAVEALRTSTPPAVEPAPAPESEPDLVAAPPIAVEDTPPSREPALPPVAPQPPTLSPAPKPRVATAAPSFARTRAGLRGAMPTRWQSFATIGALSVLLVLQLLLAQRDALAQTARWRPTMSALCAVVRCTLPAWRDPEAFTMLSRDVRPHPSAAGTLQIDANFRNDARWAQAWPRLVVSLSDIDGRVLGTRAFTAREYLGDAAATQATLAPGQTAAISLSVVEPAPGVVAFSFEFR